MGRGASERIRRPAGIKSMRSAPLLAAALALALALPGGCAYYNTFYTARKHYRDADKQQLASGQEHPSPSVLDLYKRVIDKSQKVIDNYPESKWVDDARYLIAMAYLKREEWDKARGAFEDLMAKHPGSRLVPDALLGVGRTQVGMADWEGADATFADILARHPRFRRRDEVLYHLAQNSTKRRDYRRAIVGFSELLAGEAEAGVQADAHRARGEAYLAVDSPDSALADFEALARLAARPDTRFDAELKAGECLEKLGRLEEALALYGRLEREMPDPNHLPRTLLRRGGALGSLGQFDAALEVYERVAKDFPASSYAAQALYQIGLTRELHLDDVERAKEAYAKVRETAPSSEFASLADERRQSLELFGQYRAELASGEAEEEKKAEAGLLLAELTLFRMKKVDEALEAYRAVERDYPRASLAPKAAYAVAWIQEHELDDSLAAASSYRHVFDAYPDTEYGVQAGVKVGALAADSLSIHLGRVLRLKAAADSLAAAERAVLEAARRDSLAAAGGDSLAAAGGDTLAAAVAGGDSLRVAGGDSLSSAGARSDTLPPEMQEMPGMPGMPLDPEHPAFPDSTRWPEGFPRPPYEPGRRPIPK